MAGLQQPCYQCRYGGLYLDMDMEALKPIDPLLASQSIVLAAIGNDSNHKHSVNNAFMASQPQQPFWMLYLESIQDRVRQGYNEVCYLLKPSTVAAQHACLPCTCMQGEAGWQA